VQHGAVTVVYDGDGNRVAKTAGGVTTKYLVDTNSVTGYAQVLEELNSSGAITRKYTYGLQLISENQLIGSTQTVNFYGYDGHGSVRQLTSSTGAVTDTYTYDAFGNILTTTGSTPNNFKFAGEQFDPDLGLYYNRARYLDVRQGRFWGMDTFEGHQQLPTSLHRYLYANANPISLRDPSGLLTDYSDYGYGIEILIRLQYFLDYPQNSVLYGQPTGLGQNPLLKPDIFDSTRLIWMEIKPFSYPGLAEAGPAFLLYDGNFASLGYLPDTVWEPGEQPIFYAGKLFSVINISGILFYSADTNRNRLRNVQSIPQARQLLRQLEIEETTFNTVIGAGGAAVGAGIIYLINAAASAQAASVATQETAAFLEEVA
jgi:RHS repeat-associated protein